MKTLLIVRHAKSSWDNPDCKDIERPLNDRGMKDAPKMARRLKEREITPDLIISSPAIRALATGQAIAKIIGYAEGKIKIDPQLYHADEDTLLQVVTGLNDHDDCVMLVGHNPGLTVFVNLLIKEDIDNLPTCAIVAAKLKVNSWTQAAFGCGTLDFYDYPKRNLRK